MGKSQTALRHPYGFIVLATTCLFVIISAHVALNQGSAIKPYRLERLQPQELARKAFTDDVNATCSAHGRFESPCDLKKGNPATGEFHAAILGKFVKSGTKSPAFRYEQGIPESPYSVMSVPRGPPSEPS